MKKNVQLSLTGRQRDDAGAESTVKTVTAAEYYEKNGSIYIWYQEPAEDADVRETSAQSADSHRAAAEKTGAAVGAVTKSRIKLKNGILELTKTGAFHTRMVFETGREYLTTYASPYGCLPLGILTHALHCCAQDDRIIIRIKYSLTSQGRLISDCEMEILLE